MSALGAVWAGLPRRPATLTNAHAHKRTQNTHARKTHTATCTRSHTHVNTHTHTRTHPKLFSHTQTPAFTLSLARACSLA